MIHSHRWLLFLGLLLFLAFSGHAHAQQDASTRDKEEVAALREKAFTLLDTVAGQLTTLQSAENRARIGYNLAYSLWDHDRDRARTLLRLVQEDIRTELQKGIRPGSDNQTFAVFLKLRQDTIERIAKLDAEAAFEFLKATEPIFDGPTPNPIRSHEETLQLQLAKKVASSNPDIALSLGRRTLERGFATDLIPLLARLGRNNEQQANILFKEIVDKLRDVDLVRDWTNRYFAYGLVTTYKPPAANESTYRQLIGVFVAKAIESGCGNNLPDGDERMGFCIWVASIPSVAQYDSRAARLKHWETDGGYYDALSFSYQEIDELLQENSYEQLESLAEKRPELRDTIQIRLVQQAIYSDDFEHARKLIDRFIADPARRKEMLAIVERREGKATVAVDEKLAQIKKKLEEIPTDIGRAWFLLEQASQVGRIDRKSRLKLLDQAGDIVDTLKPGANQTGSRLVMAIEYCFEKDERGFALMESLVPKLNELIEMAAKLDGYDTNYMRDGEWNMSANGSIGALLTQLSQNAGYFAWFDFDRAVSLASQFERPEIRMMAHLKLAQSVLAGPPKRVLRY